MQTQGMVEMDCTSWGRTLCCPTPPGQSPRIVTSQEYPPWSDMPTLGWVNSITNNVESQLKMHIREYIWLCLSPNSISTLHEKVATGPLGKTGSKLTGSTEPKSSKSSNLMDLILFLHCQYSNDDHYQFFPGL